MLLPPVAGCAAAEASPLSTAVVLSARRGQCGQRTTSIGRVLYVERLTAGSTTAARKCLLITLKIIIPPPDSKDPSDGPPYFAKKTFPRCQLGPTGSASLLRTKKGILPRLAGIHLGGRLTCGPTKLTGTEAFVNFSQYMNDSSSSDCTMSIQRP